MPHCNRPVYVATMGRFAAPDTDGARRLHALDEFHTRDERQRQTVRQNCRVSRSNLRQCNEIALIPNSFPWPDNNPVRQILTTFPYRSAGIFFCKAGAIVPGGRSASRPRRRRRPIAEVENPSAAARTCSTGGKKDRSGSSRNAAHVMVGETGFEPATLWSQTRCATRLRYSPTDRRA